ncbi:MAG: DUF5674 family protein [bacterium]
MSPKNDILITDRKVSMDRVKTLCERWFGDMVKMVVDIEKGIMGLGGDLHADAEALLIQNGSLQENIWGVNLYPDLDSKNRIEFTALINIRPAQNNPSMEILDDLVKKKVKAIIERLVLGFDEEGV